MAEEIVYLNGELVPRSRAHISVYDQGFLYGYGLFETMRAYGGSSFLLERHLERLRDAAGTIGLGAGLAGKDLSGACNDTLRANGLRDARLRLTVSRGEVDTFPGPASGVSPTVLVTARAYTPLPVEVYNRGFRAIVSSRRRFSRSPLAGVKSANYLLSALAKMEAATEGFDEALLLNERGSLAEGSTSNVFLVSSSGLVTPSPDSGILPGITRGVVMALAAGLGIAVNESDVRLARLEGFTEAFLTSSVTEIMPLVAVRDGSGRDITVGSGKPGEITRKLMAAYKDMVARETG